MVKTLTVKCPHCNNVSKIFLSTNACVIILNCPACFSPVMYFDHKIFLLNRQQVEAIKKSSGDSAVMRMLQRIARAGVPVRKTVKRITGSYAPQHYPNSHVQVAEPPQSWGEKYISDDDITNLRIELAVCRDSKQFIDQL